MRERERGSERIVERGSERIVEREKKVSYTRTTLVLYLILIVKKYQHTIETVSFGRIEKTNRVPTSITSKPSCGAPSDPRDKIRTALGGPVDIEDDLSDVSSSSKSGII